MKAVKELCRPARTDFGQHSAIVDGVRRLQLDKNQLRLAGCFLAVFPELNADEIAEASTASVSNWDSVASVALISTVEEQFGICIEIDDLARFNSFAGFLAYLREVENGQEAPHGEGTLRQWIH